MFINRIVRGHCGSSLAERLSWVWPRPPLVSRLLPVRVATINTESQEAKPQQLVSLWHRWRVVPGRGAPMEIETQKTKPQQLVSVWHRSPSKVPFEARGFLASTEVL